MVTAADLLDLDLDVLTPEEEDALLERLARDATADLALLDDTMREYPLVGWVAWDCPPQRPSQRRAMMALGAVATFLFGGNRSGKTEALRALCVAFLLGRDHPMIVGWAAVNGFNLEAMGVPLGPGRGFLVAKTSNDSIRYHRKQVDRLLPREGKRWSNMLGRGEAVVRIRVQGYDEEAELYFKSEDQGREGMQGDSIRFAGVDEEIAEDVWDELLLRLGDQTGRIFCSMTPLKGLTWVYERYSGERKEAEEGSRAHWLDALDNPHLDKAWFGRLYRTMSEAVLEARRFGRFTVLDGLVYPLWSRSVHLADPAELSTIPPDWLRFRAMDHGARHNTCVLWAALGPDGVLVVYRELYAPGLATAEIARRIHEAEGYIPLSARDVSPDEVGRLPAWEREYLQVGPNGPHLPDRWDPTYAEEIEGSVADPSAVDVLRDLAAHYGITFARARRDWREGRNSVDERLALETDGRPRLLVLCDERGNPTAPNLVREIETYVDPRPGTAGDTPPPRPLGGDDAVDVLRYLCMRTRQV